MLSRTAGSDVNEAERLPVGVELFFFQNASLPNESDGEGVADVDCDRGGEVEGETAEAAAAGGETTPSLLSSRLDLSMDSNLVDDKDDLSGCWGGPADSESAVATPPPCPLPSAVRLMTTDTDKTLSG